MKNYDNSFSFTYHFSRNAMQMHRQNNNDKQQIQFAVNQTKSHFLQYVYVIKV